MSDAIEATLVSFSANAKGERRLGFCIPKDDASKVNILADMIGHKFGLALAKIDYDNPQPAQED